MFPFMSELYMVRVQKLSQFSVFKFALTELLVQSRNGGDDFEAFDRHITLMFLLQPCLFSSILDRNCH